VIKLREISEYTNCISSVQSWASQHPNSGYTSDVLGNLIVYQPGELTGPDCLPETTISGGFKMFLE